MQIQSIKNNQSQFYKWANFLDKTKKGVYKRFFGKIYGLTLGQAEWWIKELSKKGIIKRTNKFEYKLGRRNRQAIYRYIGKD